jgi:hypothetical protein
MKKEQFIASFEAQVQLEVDKMNVAGDAPEAFHCAAVAQLFFEYLKDAEIGLLDFEPCSYFAESAPGQGEISINGYYLSDDHSELHLFSVVKADAVGAKVSRTDVKSAIDKAFRFYKRAVAKTATPFHDDLDEALAPHAAAKSIHGAKSSIAVVSVYVFSDGECERLSVYPEEIEGLTFAPQFWDIERLHKQMISGSEREEIVIDFKQEHGESLPAMKMLEPKGGYICYVGFVSGTVLADMYSKHSSRLIEQNVRMYLQARGKVNSGIQSTIKDSPGRFLAYNNGLSLTAKSVEISGLSKSGHCQIDRITELQIVNGAQTTGSIFHALKKEGRDVSGLRVQFKLTVPLSSQTMADLVSAISRYSNSQNAVKVTDLSANQPYHVELEKLSRSIYTPVKGDGSAPTRWYYERARGAYMIDRGNHPGVAWLRQNPPEQMFTKVDLGKSEVTFWGEPQVVSKGGEKNFVHFMEQITEKNPKVDEDAFKDVAGRLILVRSMEDVVKGLKQGGYKANVVAYGLAYLYSKYGPRLDFHAIWKSQAVSDNMKKVLTVLAKRAFEHINDTPPGVLNVTEWAKKDRCWETFAGKSIAIELGEQDGLKASGASPGKTTVGIPKKPKAGTKELPEEMRDAAAWLEMTKWSLDRNEYLPKQRLFMKGVSAILRKKQEFTAAQVKWAISLWESAKTAGFSP